MQSNIIKITGESESIEKILCETQKTAKYAELNAKQSMRTRLIAEELIGLLKELSANFDGDFWIEQENLSFTFFTQLELNENMDKQTKKKFIDISSDKKNASAVGIMGKIQDVVENLLYPENAVYSTDFIAHQLETAVLMDDSWTLSRYKDSQKENTDQWDELEKSIIANLADDVTVSVKGNKVEIAIIKDFNQEK